MAVVYPDNNTFTGSEADETAVSTQNNETFNLGTGTDEIDFTANAGYYGNDTIITNSGENLNLILPTSNYYLIKDGDDIKITTYTDTKYVLTALVTAVNDDFTLEGDGDIDINYAIENNRIKFYLEYDSSKGGYIWKRYLCDNGDQNGSGTTISLTNSILAADTYTRDGVTFSDFEIKKVPYATINNVYTEGASLENITEAYISALNESVTANGENNYYFNNNYMSTPSLTSTITLEDYALDNKGTVTINGDDIEVNITGSNITEYTGSRLNEYVSLPSSNINHTVDLKTGNDTVYVNIGNYEMGNDVITLNQNENLKISFSTTIKEQVEYSISGNDIVLTVYGYSTIGSGYNAQAFVDRSRIIGTITILNGANIEYNATTTLTFVDSYGNSPEYLCYIGNRNSNQDQNLMGSFRDEKFTVGLGNDTVTTNGGNNKILIQRAGNNTINLTNGADSVDTITVSNPGRNVYEPSAYSGRPNPNIYNTVAQNKTVIKNSDQYDTINFYGSYDSETHAYIDFYRKDNSNDLDIIVRNGAYLCGSTARYTIEDYFNDSKINIINSYGYTFDYDETNNKFIRTYTYNSTTADYKINKLIEGSGTVSGTNGDDGIIASGKATITTGKGNDKIYTSNASDTINIDGSGKKHIIIDPNSGNDTITLSSYKEINAGTGDDVIKATNLKYVTVFGGDGDDKIETNLDGNTIYGGKGSDYLVSKNNNERGDVELVFNDGDGKDYIEIENANVTLKFQDRKSYTGMKFQRYGNDLLIKYTSSDSIVLKDYYKEFEGTLADYDNNNDAYQDALNNFNNKKSTFKLLFNDGHSAQLTNLITSVYDLQPETGTITGTAKNDYINIENRTKATTINTLAGNDTILANNRNGITINAGDGTDTITAKNNTNTTINSGNDADTIEISGTNLTVNAGDGKDTIIAQGVSNSTINAGYSGDGEYYDDDTVTISGSDNTLSGGKGNDYFSNVEGEASNSTIEFNAGDGIDVVDFNNGVQVLKFNDKNQADITLQKYGRNLLIKYTANDWVTVRGYYDENSQSSSHYKLHFADSTEDVALSSFVSSYGAISDTIPSTINGTDYRDYIEFTGNTNTHYTINAGYSNDVINATVNGSNIDAYSGNDIVTITGNNNTVNGHYGDDVITVVGDGNAVIGGDDNDIIKVKGNNNLIRGDYNGYDDYGYDTIEVEGSGNTIWSGSYNDSITVKGSGSNHIHSGYYNDYITNGGADCGNNTIYFGYDSNNTPSGYHYYEYEDTGFDTLDFDKGTQTLKFMGNELDDFVLKQKDNDLRIYYTGSSYDAAIIKDYFDTTKTKATYVLKDKNDETINLDTFVANHQSEIEQENTSESQSAKHVDSSDNLVQVDDLTKEYWISGNTNDQHIITNVNNSTIWADGDNTYWTIARGNDLIEVAGSNNTIYGDYAGMNDYCHDGGNDYFKNIEGKTADNTTIVFKPNNMNDTVDFKGGTQTLFFDHYSISLANLNLVKDEKDLVIKYAENSSVRILNYFDETITDKANYLIRRYKYTNDTIADTIITLEDLIAQNGIVDETTTALPENGWTTTATQSNSLTGTDNADNLVINETYENAQVYLEYDAFNISQPVYDYNNSDAYFAFKEPFTYQKDGDDLIINHKGTIYNAAQNQNETTTGSITVKDYFKDEFKNVKMMYEGSENTIYDIAEVIRKCVTFDVMGKRSANNNLVGSKYSENFIGGDKNDTISTGGGDDIVTAGKGKNTVNIDGSGDKTIVVKKGDGTTTINGVNNSTSTNIKAEEFNNNQICWSKSGNNIVLHFLNLDTLTSDDITISDYFREDGSVNNEIKERLKIKGNAFSTSTFSNFVQGKKIKSIDTPISLVGTGKNDTITSNVAGDVVYAGNGNDTIYVNNTSTTAADTNIYAGKGKDKIIVKDALFEEGSGITNINLAKDDGNKTVVITEELKNTHHTLNFNFLSSDNYSRSYGYFKNGNDLIIKASYNPYSSSAKSSQIAVTVKNYFKWDLGERVQINNESVSYKDLSIIGVRNKKKKVTEFIGTNNRDTVTGTKKADYITTGANYDTITPGKGNDTVYIDGTGSKTIYIHNGDGNDTIKYKENISDTKQYLALQYDSPYILSGARNGDDYIISRTYDNNKTFTTETTTIKDYYKEGFGGEIHSSLRPDSLMTKVEGNAKKANNIAVESSKLTLNGKTTAGEEGEFNNILITAGKKNDTVVTTASNTKIFTGAGNDKVTLNGEGYSYAYTGAGKDNVTISAAGYGTGYAYTGDGNDTITATSGYSNRIYTGNGNDTVTITGGSNTIYLKGGEGNDTIIHEGSDFENTVLSFSNYTGTKNYHKSGNDLLIKYAYKNGKKKTKTETHTIKDYFIKDSAENGSLGTKIYIDSTGIASTLYSQGLNLPGKYDKKQKATIFEGTEYKDIITGTKKKDIVTTGNGDDKIELGKGDDKITINGTGTKNITIANGDGNDTVEFAENTVGTVSFKMDSRDLFYVSDHNNKVDITRIYEVNGNVKKETTSVIRTSEDSSLQNILINGNALSALPQYQDIEQFEANKPNTVTSQNIVVIGGNKNDDITLTGDCSAAFAGKGNDKITVGQGNSVITGGKGNDTIIINSSNVQQVGNVTINHAKGDGNDTVEFAGNAPVQNVTINAFSDINSPNSYALYVSNKTGFIKAGDDLIFNIQKSSNKSETITFKDYFAEENNNPDAIDFKITFKDKNIPATFSNWGLWIDGVYDAVQKATVYDGTTEYKQRYIYNGSGKAIMNGGINNDNYIVTINKKSNLLIGDKSGLDTILMTADKNNLRAFFNVNSSGDVLVNENQNSDNLIIFNKANLTAKNLSAVLNGNGKGVINIDNFFTQNTSSNSFTAGTGCIEQILVSKNMAKNYTNIGNGGIKYIQQVNTNNWINSVAESVSSWLTDKGYANTMEVLESGKSTDIASLIKVYAGVKCETVALGS